MRGKKPLTDRMVKSLRKVVEGNELHELLLNIGVDTMLRASDLLNLKVKDLVNESGSIKSEVKVKMKKTGKSFEDIEQVQLQSQPYWVLELILCKP